MVKFDRLYYFQRIAKTGSIRSAAAELYISESALSKSLRLLEEEMECPLFDRKGKRLQLNEDGAFLLSLVDDLLMQADNLKASLDQHRGIDEQIVMDTFFDHSVNFIIHVVLNRYFPGTRFVWKNTEQKAEAHLQELIEGTTDIAIVPIATKDMIELMPICQRHCVNSTLLVLEQLYLSAPKGTEMDYVKTMTVAETRDLHMLKPVDNYASLWYENILLSKRKKPVYQYTMPARSFLQNWVNCPNPFVTTSLYMTHKDYVSGFAQRHQIRFTDPEAERGIFLLYRNKHSQIIELFASAYKQQFYEIFTGTDRS